MNAKSQIREFLHYVTLNIFGMLGLSCYILADTFFVSGGLGANGLTALNLAIPVYSFIHGSGLMLGMGGATKYSVFRGQKQYQKADQIFTNAIYLTFILAGVFMLLGIFFSERLTAALHADSEVFDMTKTYLQIILLFAPAFMMNDVLLCFVRNDGSPGLAMAAMLTGSLSNIVMDYIFIFPLQMGILGAVLATGFSPVIGMCILSKHWIKKQNNFHLAKCKPSPRLTGNIILLGVPSLITEVASGTVMIVFNHIILRLQGNTGVAAYGIVANLSLVVISIYTGIAQGIQPIISRAYGSGKGGQVNVTLKYAIVTMLLISGCIYAVFLLCANPIAGIFNSEHNTELQQMAASGIRLYFTAIPFAGFNIILSMYFSSLERALPAQAVSLSRGFFIVIPMAFFLSCILGMTGVWLSYPVTEITVFIMGLSIFHLLRRRAGQ